MAEKESSTNKGKQEDRDMEAYCTCLLITPFGLKQYAPNIAVKHIIGNHVADKVP